MTGMVRLTAAVNRVNVANPGDCLEEIQQVLQEQGETGWDIAVFPSLALCSPSSGSLMQGPGLPARCEEALGALLDATAGQEGYLIVGLPVDDLGRSVSAMAVLHRGELVALVPAERGAAAPGGYSDNLVPPETLFSCNGLRFCILGSGVEALAVEGAKAVSGGCDLLIVPAYDPVYAGLTGAVRESAMALSRAAGCAVAVVNGGVGDTSSPWLYQGLAAIYECGEELACQVGDSASFSVTADLDPDIIRACKGTPGGHSPSYSIVTGEPGPGLLRPLRQNPWLPAKGREAYLDELFAFQARSLAARMENTGLTRPVVGVSGGLDSTAALLAAAAACDLLGLERSSIVGITMPGFGTSDRTYYNALALLEHLGATSRDISIRAAVQQHFEDIGHGGERDTVYENAQARERAQVLLDVANQVGGLVVGTGDLSEEALGFCTFAGDQIANYNVNVCLTKTVLRELVRHVADTGRIADVADVVTEVLDTPVSPELLPPGQEGEIRQMTEEILGPYLLHDFFLYHFARYRMGPEKLYAYACATFAGELAPGYIREKLSLFFKKLCAGQFKRACAPDAASITQVNLCGVNFYIPSDLDPSTLLREVERCGPCKGDGAAG